MDIKKSMAAILGIIVVVVIFKKFGGGASPQDYERLSEAFAVATCADELQRAIPVPEVTQNSNVADGLNAIGGVDPAAAAELSNLLASVSPKKADEKRIPAAELRAIYTKGLVLKGISALYANKLLGNSSAHEVATFTKNTQSKSLALCPNANAQSAEVLKQAIDALRQSAK